MSGHSHWSGIKHKKGLADAQRSKAFSKMAKEITLAAKAGPDPQSNSALRAVLEKAREINMPKENVERSIKKATEKGNEGNLQEFLLEAYGPGGIALLISGITDNKNRTLGEIKLILSKFGGKMVEGGAIQWMFEQKGEIITTIQNQKREDAELLLIEAGAQDLYWHDDQTVSVYTTAQDLEQVKASVIKSGFIVESSALAFIPKERIATTPEAKESLEKFFEALDEQDDVQEIYSNV